MYELKIFTKTHYDTEIESNPNTPLNFTCQVIIKGFNESAYETDFKSSNIIKWDHRSIKYQ